MPEPKISQALHPMQLTIKPAGEGALLIEKFTGAEGVSNIFRYQMELLAEATTKIDFDKVLGQKAVVRVALPKGNRYFHGIISRFSQGQTITATQLGITYVRYSAVMVPEVWLLSKKVQSRIFLQKSVPNILSKVLGDWKISFSATGVTGPCQTRDHCAQYMESDLHFITRLMEEEGIYYFFKHTESGHEMILADTPSGHPDLPTNPKVPYEPVADTTQMEDRIVSFGKTQEIAAGKHNIFDYCFEKAPKGLDDQRPILESIKVGTVEHKLNLAASAKLELFEYPANCAQRHDGISTSGGVQADHLGNITKDLEKTAKLRMEQEAAGTLIIAGLSNCRQFIPGHKFALLRHFNADGNYVLTAVEHSASLEGLLSRGADTTLIYRNSFQCIPADLPYRPQAVTPKPRIRGTQTAIVLEGGEGKIGPDKYGRIRVKFFWNKEGVESYWLRVGSTWSGKQWGAIHVPRVGQEVIVDFLDGDPDHPIVIGSVYNSEMTVPYTLPENWTQSGVKSRTGKATDLQKFNELRFEDKDGKEDVYFHAQKDFHRMVENDDDLKVDGNQTRTIKKNRTVTITEGNDELTIQKGNRTETITQGNETLTIQKGNRTDTLSLGNDTLSLKAGNLSVKLDAGKATYEAAQSIELKVGGSSIKIDPAMITIKAPAIQIEATGVAMVKGKNVMVTGDVSVVVQAANVMIN